MSLMTSNSNQNRNLRQEKILQSNPQHLDYLRFLECTAETNLHSAMKECVQRMHTNETHSLGDTFNIYHCKASLLLCSLVLPEQANNVCLNVRDLIRTLYGSDCVFQIHLSSVRIRMQFWKPHIHQFFQIILDIIHDLYPPSPAQGNI